MAGCSKKQYAIMMGSGDEGQKLAAKMGSMEQEEFNKAFSELIQSDSATGSENKWSPDDDEDYGDFDRDDDSEWDEGEDEDILEEYDEFDEDSYSLYNLTKDDVENKLREELDLSNLSDEDLEKAHSILAEMGVDNKLDRDFILSDIAKVSNGDDEGETFIIGENDDYGWDVEKIDENGRSERILSDLNPNSELDRLNELNSDKENRENLLSQLTSVYQEDAIESALEEAETKEEAINGAVEKYREFIKSRNLSTEKAFKKYGDDTHVADIAGKIWDNEHPDNENNELKNISYGELVRLSNDDSEEYNLSKDYIVNRGRGLAKLLSRPEEDLSETGKKVKNAIIKSAKPSNSDFSIYRTDDVDWLKDAKVGDVHSMDVYLGASLNPNTTIGENLGRVKQKMKINIKKGDPILIPNNAGEEEVDLVRTNEQHGLKIKNITKDEEGIPVYEVEMYR